jgi:hypothetical protein
VNAADRHTSPSGAVAVSDIELVAGPGSWSAFMAIRPGIVFAGRRTRTARRCELRSTIFYSTRPGGGSKPDLRSTYGAGELAPLHASVKRIPLPKGEDAGVPSTESKLMRIAPAD